MTVEKKILCEYFNLDEEMLKNKKVRFFPTSKQPEQNIKHIFLSCLTNIKNFREQLLSDIVKPITNQTASLEAYSEMTCETKDRPDALLVLTTGKSNPSIAWTALIEIKLSSQLEEEQVKRYYDFVRGSKIDCLITISNDPTSSPQNLPFSFRKAVTAECFHFSWLDIQKACLLVLKDTKRELLTIEKVLLEELIRYFKDDNVKVKDFVVGKTWKDDSLELFDTSIKRKNKEVIERIASNWVQEEADLCFHIYERTGLELIVKNANKNKNDYLTFVKNEL